MTKAPAPELTKVEARRILLHASGLDREWPVGAEGCRAVLDELGCIQLDPIDRMGTNADLVVNARVDGTVRGDLHRAVAGHAFEHFAKERCLLHARFFAHYRGRAVQARWWRHTERMKKVDDGLVADVLAEVRDRGPLSPQQLQDRGKVEPLEWDGWSGTSKASSIALEVLWTRCELVVGARDEKGRRVYDLPERALGAWATAAPQGQFEEELLLARVAVAGLLTRSSGPQWSMLSDTRTDGTVDRLVADGRLVERRVGRRPYLTLPRYLDPPAAVARPPRALGPLDPFVWDRQLIEEIHGFAYTWDVYKPAAQRQFGWYVVPVLAGGELVGRIEAVREEGRLRLVNAWGLPSIVRDEVFAHLCLLNAAVLPEKQPRPTRKKAKEQ